eukprot:6024638-Ditylum_brightwellii.AAC.1
MHRASADGFVKAVKQPKTDGIERSFSHVELFEVGKTFDAFDRSGDGRISYEELRSTMSSLGVTMSENALQKVVAQLDTDGNGEISKEEFLEWYESAIDDDGHSMHERAEFLFKLFDRDDSGEITIGEFKAALDVFNI